MLLGSNFRSNDLSTLNAENFDRIMAESIHKAIDSPERCPVKEKHVRKLLIGCFQAQSGAFFWRHLPVIRLKEEMLVCWKFCYVLHKMLRDGPPQVVRDSNEHKKVLIDCGNMWRYVEEKYGKLINNYCTLLYNRINFLMRNPHFPNDLRMSEDLIGKIDLNVLFEFSCELFDALENVERLVIKALDAFEKQRLSSSTNPGKCLLAPLVACVQDASLLYDYCIKIMFRLHTELDVQSLTGHRERFGRIHQEFYWVFKRTRDLQYFRTLLQIPHVSIEPPDFLLASDIQKHSAATKVTVIEQSSRADSTEELDSQCPLVDVSYQEPVSTPTPSLGVDSSHSVTSSTQINDAFDPNPNLNLNSSLKDSNSNSNPSPECSGVQDDAMVTNTSLGAASILAQHNEYADTIGRLEAQIEQLKSIVDQEREQRSEMQLEMQSKLDAMAQSHSDQVRQLESEMKSLKDESVNLKAQLTTTKTALEKIRQECDKANHNNEISRLAVRKMAEEKSHIEKEMEKLRNNATGSQSKVTTTTTATATETETPEIDQKANELLIGELNKKIETMSLQLSERELECQRLNQEFEVLASSKARLEQQLDTNQSNLMMAEMIETDKIIKYATNRIEELSEKSRRIETGIKLQVNEKISEVCTCLMKAVRNLMLQSDLLQREVVGAHGMTNNVEDFYKRNSSWTDGLISAAKVVAIGAKSLVDSADRAMSGAGKYSELAAAAHEIATATTQLVVASRVKANKDSEKLKMLTSVAKQVNQCTGNVVDTARICADLIEKESEQEFDVSTLSLHQTKKLEMETQVKLLELENDLSKERIKLGFLRRRHYEQEAQNGADQSVLSQS